MNEVQKSVSVFLIGMSTCIHNPHWLHSYHTWWNKWFLQTCKGWGGVGENLRHGTYGHNSLLHNKIGVGTSSFGINSRFSMMRPLWEQKRICMMSGFRHDVNDIRALSGFYAVQNGSFLLTFRDNLSGPFSRLRQSKKSILLRLLDLWNWD